MVRNTQSCFTFQLCLYSSQELCLDLALNVLSRGLEQNQENSDIWLHYLTLYSKRTNCGDLMQLCKQAVQYAPSYKIWWKVGYQ